MMALPARRADVRTSLRPRAPDPAPWALLLGLMAAVAAFVYLLGVVAGRVQYGTASSDAEAPGGGHSGRGAEGASVAAGFAAGSSAASLESAIRAVLTPEEAATTSVAVMTAEGAWLGGLNPDFPGYAASTFKLAVLFEAERRVSTGELSYHDRLAITDEARAEDLGTIDRLPIAQDGTVSLGEALRAMVAFSDNASAVALLRLLGPAAVDAAMHAVGARVFSVNDRGLPVTARDLTLVLGAIARGEGMAAAQRDHALRLLAEQESREGIPRALGGLPGLLRVGNKTGTWPGVTRDAAIVETDRGTYVIAIMGDGDWNWELVRRVARAVHEHLTSR